VQPQSVAEILGVAVVAKQQLAKFTRGDKVKVRGRKTLCTITWPMVVPVPTIVNNQFTLVETVMYKFITDKETFYAYEKDISK
jgi:hypothetical protein